MKGVPEGGRVQGRWAGSAIERPRKDPSEPKAFSSLNRLWGVENGSTRQS
jgi:hypothetical protein